MPPGIFLSRSRCPLLALGGGLHPEASSRCPVSRTVPGQCPSGVSAGRQDERGRAGEAVGVTVSVGVTHKG